MQPKNLFPATPGLGKPTPGQQTNTANAPINVTMNYIKDPSILDM
jgi:hypothetical protein